MPKITRRFGFDAGHRLTTDPESPCFNLHGHRYECELTLISERLDEESMVLNFHTVKSVLVEPIMQNLDHALILNPDDTSGIVELCEKNKWKFKLLREVPSVPTWQTTKSLEPTVENIAEWIKKIIEGILELRYPDAGFVVQIKLYETPNCWTETSIGGIYL